MAVPPGDSTLTAMITPALFMTATGSLIISTSNRMARVVDKIHQLNVHADELSRGASKLDFPADRLNNVVAQLERLVARNDRIRLALTLLYLAMAMFVVAELRRSYSELPVRWLCDVVLTPRPSAAASSASVNNQASARLSRAPSTRPL